MAFEANLNLKLKQYIISKHPEIKDVMVHDDSVYFELWKYNLNPYKKLSPYLLSLLNQHRNIHDTTQVSRRLIKYLLTSDRDYYHWLDGSWNSPFSSIHNICVMMGIAEVSLKVFPSTLMNLDEIKNSLIEYLSYCLGLKSLPELSENALKIVYCQNTNQSDYVHIFNKEILLDAVSNNKIIEISLTIRERDKFISGLNQNIKDMLKTHYQCDLYQLLNKSPSRMENAIVNLNTLFISDETISKYEIIIPMGFQKYSYLKHNLPLYRDDYISDYALVKKYKALPLFDSRPNLIQELEKLKETPNWFYYTDDVNIRNTLAYGTYSSHTLYTIDEISKLDRVPNAFNLYYLTEIRSVKEACISYCSNEYLEPNFPGVKDMDVFTEESLSRFIRMIYNLGALIRGYISGSEYPSTKPPYLFCISNLNELRKYQVKVRNKISKSKHLMNMRIVLCNNVLSDLTLYHVLSENFSFPRMWYGVGIMNTAIYYHKLFLGTQLGGI